MSSSTKQNYSLGWAGTIIGFFTLLFTKMFLHKSDGREEIYQNIGIAQQKIRKTLP